MNNILNDIKKTSQLPWWTGVVSLLIFHLGSEISASLKYIPGATFFYLPTCFGVVLINWWGPKRVIPVMYINAVFSAFLWDVGPWYYWPLLSIPGTLFIALSWYFFTKQSRGKYWLPDSYSLISFLLYGLCIPLLIEIFLLEGAYFLTGLRSTETFFFTFIRSSLGEFISNFGLTVPVLYYFTPRMKQKGLLIETKSNIADIEQLDKKHKMEIALIYFVILILSLTIPFNKFWFIYGVFSLSVAIRYGFGLAILTNTYIFLLTYITPIVTDKIINTQNPLEDHVINIYLGTSLLYVFAAITGRVISDVTYVEKRMVDQLYQMELTNKELEMTNRELDRFAYSVSHDLSAPLKSILGLVSISKMTTSLDEHLLYFNKIEFSVKKLDTFIHGILDYSRNKRQELTIESVNIKELCLEIIENLQYIEGIKKVKIDMEGISKYEVQTDSTRLKIIINNILTNAFKFQKADQNYEPLVKISSKENETGMHLEIEDNGEGIHPEIKDRIFTMFFRGNPKSKGSGLGLYIAKEAAEKIDCYISVTSVFGKGTTFAIDLKELNRDNITTITS